MSTEATAAVLRAKIGDPSKKAVLLGMAEHAGPDGGNCYVSIARIVAYTELSRSTVKAKLAEMVEQELVIVTQEARQHFPRVYRIDIHRLKHMVHPVVQQLDDRNRRTATSGGAKAEKDQGASSRPSEIQTVNGDGPDGQLTAPDGQMADPDGQLTDPGGQLSDPNQVLNLKVLNPLNQRKNRGPEKSESQTPLVRALASIKSTFPARLADQASGVYRTYFEPLELDRIADDEVLLVCESADQARWLRGNGKRYLEQAFMGVLGRRVVVMLQAPEEREAA